MKRQAPYLIVILVLGVLDQIAKAWVVSAVPLYGVKRIIPGFFDLTHIRNSGAIFGLMSRSGSRLVTYGLVGLQLFALAMVVFYFLKTPPSEKPAKWAMAIILGGALGNFVDRLVRGYVIDFLELYAGRFHWPTFNLADSCITVGAVALIATILLRRPHAPDSR